MASAPPERLPLPLNAAQRRRLLRLMREQYRGVVNSGEPIILDSVIRFVKVTGGPKEMNFKRPRRKGKP